MSGRDGRDDADAFESTDWLLAQLGQGRRPDLEGHDAPPVAEPAVEPQAEPIAPAPADPEPAEREPVEPPARRSEETLDWFSLAEPAPRPDAATRELPVVGEPIDPREPTAPLQPASPQSAPPAGPEWTTPYGVRPPVVPPQSPPPPAEPTSRLTSVEPPVGTGAVGPLPPVLPPVPPAGPPAAPPAASPPGPVTPPASFALTWGEPQIDSEAGLRAAFRQLSEPSAPAEPEPPQADGARDPHAPSSPPPPASSPVPPEPTPPAPAAQAGGEPFESFTRPPAAADSAATVPPPSPAPPSAPPSWDDLAAAAASRSAQASRPAHEEPEAPAAPGHSDDYADELWSAMHESDAQPPAPGQASPAEAPPAATPPAFEAFGAFAAYGTAPVEPPSQPEPEARQAETPQAEAPQAEAPFQAEPQAEPRGRFAAFADDAVDAPVAPPPAFGAPLASSAPSTRPPFEPAPAGADLPPHQAFSPAPFGNPTAFGGPTPVDDLLAALGGGLAAGQGDRGTFGQSVSEEVDDSARRPLPPMTGPIPSGFSELGLALGAASSYSRRDDEPDDHVDQSSIARQIAETGYFWNLTPDPGGVDPKAPADVAASGADRAPETESDEELGLEFEPEPEPFDPFAAVRPGADPAAPDTDPFGLRQVFGDERDPSAARAAQAAASAEADTHAEPSPTAALPAARPNGGDHDPLASIFGAGPGLVDATFPDAQADPWATAGYDAAGRGPANGAPTAGAVGAAVLAGGGSGGAGGGPGGPSGAGGGPSGPSAPTASGSSGGRRSPVKVLAWIAGGLVAVLVLVGLFFLGTQLTGGARDAASESPSPSETTPEAAPEPTAPQPVGVHAWDTLFGGECLDPFTDPWAEEFTVVDCAAPHAAQLVYRGVLPGDAAAPFPGEAALAGQMPALCSAAGVIDLGAAGGLNDLQVQGTFPVTEEQWADGERTYYCFANRSSGEPLTASVQGPGPAV